RLIATDEPLNTPPTAPSPSTPPGPVPTTPYACAPLTYTPKSACGAETASAPSLAIVPDVASDVLFVALLASPSTRLPPSPAATTARPPPPPPRRTNPPRDPAARRAPGGLEKPTPRPLRLGPFLLHLCAPFLRSVALQLDPPPLVVARSIRLDVGLGTAVTSERCASSCSRASSASAERGASFAAPPRRPIIRSCSGTSIKPSTRSSRYLRSLPRRGRTSPSRNRQRRHRRHRAHRRRRRRRPSPR